MGILAIARLVLGVALLAPTAAMAKPTIVLVHGAFETSAVWSKVTAILRKDGYRTIAVDLPGRDGVPAADPAKGLDPYRDTVLAAIAREKQPVVLVGHSFGGMTISAVGEAAPERIKTLVYVAAYLPTNGQSLLSLSQADADSKMGPAFRISDDKRTASIDAAARGDLFCNGCDSATKAAVANGIIPEPLAPPTTPDALTAERFGTLDKVYIHTARDVVVSPKLQATMVGATPVRKELSVDTGHAPFAASPLELAKAIEAAIQ